MYRWLFEETTALKDQNELFFQAITRNENLFVFFLRDRMCNHKFGAI